MFEDIAFSIHHAIWIIGSVALFGVLVIWKVRKLRQSKERHIELIHFLDTRLATEISDVKGAISSVCRYNCVKSKVINNPPYWISVANKFVSISRANSYFVKEVLRLENHPIKVLLKYDRADLVELYKELIWVLDVLKRVKYSAQVSHEIYTRASFPRDPEKCFILVADLVKDVVDATMIERIYQPKYMTAPQQQDLPI